MAESCLDERQEDELGSGREGWREGRRYSERYKSSCGKKKKKKKEGVI